jgi:hypothetical protein
MGSRLTIVSEVRGASEDPELLLLCLEHGRHLIRHLIGSSTNTRSRSGQQVDIGRPDRDEHPGPLNAFKSLIYLGAIAVLIYHAAETTIMPHHREAPAHLKLPARRIWRCYRPPTVDRERGRIAHAPVRRAPRCRVLTTGVQNVSMTMRKGHDGIRWEGAALKMVVTLGSS